MRNARLGSVSRRSLIAGMGVAAAGAACGASRAARAAETPDWMPAWDDEADVVAIGAGGAGLAAGIEARDQGMSVIVLESQESFGGNSARCNGGMCIPGSPLQAEQGIEDSPELMYEDLVAYTQEDNYPEFIKLTCEQQALLWDWLTGMGIEFKAESLIATTGQSVAREHHVGPYVAVETLYDNAVDRGADIRFSTPATHLVQNPVTKEILGVTAETPEGKEIHIKAKKGVLLCSGGYARSVEMLNKWIFGPGRAEQFMASCMDAPGQDGSGILMAMEVGADTRHIDYINMLTARNPKGTVNDACSMFHVGAVLVNKEGERFVNEAKGYIGVWTDVNAQTDSECFQIWDQPLYDEYADNDSHYYSMSKLTDSGLLLRADTLEDLAEQMGVPADTLVATMEKYNSDVEGTGKDSQFGREHLVSMAGVPMAIKTPPFYAWETTNTICCTKGGIRQDATQGCQAVDVMGNLIPRLYLAGNISGYSNFGIKPGTREAVNSSGIGFGGAIALGRYCAQQIAQRDDWDA